MKSKITLLRNFFGLFLFVGLFSLSANAQTVVLSEDFSSITVGNSDDTSGSGTAWNGNENFVVDPTNSKAYQAGGAVRLGTGSVIGFITSVPLDLSQGGGAFTISFDIKGWSAAGNIKVIVKDAADVTIAEETVAYENFNTSSTVGVFQTKTVNLTGGVANATIRFETTTIPATSARRAYIDNVVVTVPEVTATLDAPVATAATVIENNSFTANWDAVTGATAYRLDISTISDFSSFVAGYNNVPVDGTSYEVTGLMSNTTYYYRVRAVDADETSANSNVIEVTTECGPFALPDLTIDQYCPGSTVADLPLYGEEGYNWFANTTDTTPLADSEVLANGTTYYLMQTINNCDSSRMPYVVNIVIVEAPVYEDAEVEVCNGGTIADITLPESGYLFYTTATAETPLESTEELVNGATLFVSRVVEGCESERTEIMIEIVVPAVPVGSATQQFTAGQTLADLVVTAEDDLIWYAEETLETELDPTTALENNTTYYAVNVDEPCMSAPLAVTVQLALSSAAFGLDGLVVYPNPVSNVFTVTYTEPVSAVAVYNMLGQQVVKASNNAVSTQVDMSGVAAGTYMVKVVSGNETATFKVVKQ